MSSVQNSAKIETRENPSNKGSDNKTIRNRSNHHCWLKYFQYEFLPHPDEQRNCGKPYKTLEKVISKLNKRSYKHQNSIDYVGTECVFFNLTLGKTMTLCSGDKRSMSTKNLSGERSDLDSIEEVSYGCPREDEMMDLLSQLFSQTVLPRYIFIPSLCDEEKQYYGLYVIHLDENEFTFHNFFSAEKMTDDQKLNYDFLITKCLTTFNWKLRKVLRDKINKSDGDPDDSPKASELKKKLDCLEKSGSFDLRIKNYWKESPITEEQSRENIGLYSGCFSILGIIYLMESISRFGKNANPSQQEFLERTLSLEKDYLFDAVSKAVMNWISENDLPSLNLSPFKYHPFSEYYQKYAYKSAELHQQLRCPELIHDEIWMDPNELAIFSKNFHIDGRLYFNTLKDCFGDALDRSYLLDTINQANPKTIVIDDVRWPVYELQNQLENDLGFGVIGNPDYNRIETLIERGRRFSPLNPIGRQKSLVLNQQDGWPVMRESPASIEKKKKRRSANKFTDLMDHFYESWKSRVLSKAFQQFVPKKYDKLYHHDSNHYYEPELLWEWYKKVIEMFDDCTKFVIPRDEFSSSNLRNAHQMFPGITLMKKLESEIDKSVQEYRGVYEMAISKFMQNKRIAAKNRLADRNREIICQGKSSGKGVKRDFNQFLGENYPENSIGDNFDLELEVQSEEKDLKEELPYNKEEEGLLRKLDLLQSQFPLYHTIFIGRCRVDDLVWYYDDPTNTTKKLHQDIVNAFSAVLQRREANFLMSSCCELIEEQERDVQWIDLGKNRDHALNELHSPQGFIDQTMKKQPNDHIMDRGFLDQLLVATHSFKEKKTLYEHEYATFKQQKIEGRRWPVTVNISSKPCVRCDLLNTETKKYDGLNFDVRKLNMPTQAPPAFARCSPFFNHVFSSSELAWVLFTSKNKDFKKYLKNFHGSNTPNSPEYSSKTLGDRLKELELEYKLHHVIKNRILIMPMQWSDGSWLLFTINFKSRKIFYYDFTFNLQHQPNLEKMEPILLNWAKNLGGNNSDSTYFVQMHDAINMSGDFSYREKLDKFYEEKGKLEKVSTFFLFSSLFYYF